DRRLAAQRARPERKCAGCEAMISGDVNLHQKFCHDDCHFAFYLDDPRRRHADWDSRHRCRARRMGRRWERITLHDLARLYVKQKRKCSMCKGPMTAARGTKKMQQTVDHVVALRDGGDHVLANLQLLHASCHAKKSSQERLRWN